MKNVDRWYLTVEKEVPSNIFERSDVQARVQELFVDAEGMIDARIKEITEFLDIEPCYELTHKHIYALFEGYFCKHIANEAIQMAFMEQGNYNILDNIMSLLTKRQLRAAIYGKPMIDAFSRAIRSIPNEHALDASIHGSKILLLRKEYLSTKNKKNHCGECGCSCECDEGCNGDWQKCTSSKECTHHCGCYVTSMLKNMSSY